MSYRELPLRLRWYLALHVPVLLVCGVAAGRLPGCSSPGITAALALGAALFSAWKLELPVFHGRLTMAFVAISLALLLQGPRAAVLAAAAGALAGTFFRPVSLSWRLQTLRPPFYRVWFNVANCLLAAVAGCLLYQALAQLPLPADWRTLFALGGFVAAHFVVNSSGVALAMAYQQGADWRTIWSDKLLWTFPGFLAGAGVALVTETLLPVLGARALLFLPITALVFYWSRLYAERVSLTEKERADKAHIEELNRLNESVISALASAIDAKDRYTCSQIRRVRIYAEGLARAVGLEGAEFQAVSTGAMLHDIGKLGVPDHILCKPGKLTPDEYRRCQEHVGIGAQILAQVQFPFPVVDVVLTHHERWDGRGYPRGLKGEEIPIGGRIIAIADVFDALTSNRPYRRAMSHEDALLVLESESGKAFDPHLVQLFSAIFPELEQACREGQQTDAVTEPEILTPFARISQAAVELSMLCDAAEALAGQHDLPEVYHLLVNRALGLVPVDTAVLYLRAEGSLTAAEAAGPGSERLIGMRMELGEGIAGCVARKGETQCNILAAADVARRYGPEVQPELVLGTAVPLRCGSEITGVLAVYTCDYRQLQPAEVEVLEILAQHGARAVENLSRMRQDRTMAYTDATTELYNARYLLQALALLQEDRPTGVLLLDLDHFKQVNDLCGHLVGDEVLRRVAQVLKAATGPNDTVCRYGGDEFVLLLPDRTPEELARVSERIQRDIDALPPAGGRVKVGVSIGASFYPQDGRTARELIEAADGAMYREKRGRRGVLPAEAASPEPELLKSSV